MIIDRLEQVEDTKGNNGERGHWGRVLSHSYLRMGCCFYVLTCVSCGISRCRVHVLGVKIALLVVSCACVNFLTYCMKDD